MRELYPESKRAAKMTETSLAVIDGALDDLASAAVLLMEMAEAPPGIVNVGTGQDLTIRELAVQIASLVGFGGRLVFNEDYPDGAPRKLLDIGRITALGWRPRIRLADGLAQVVDHYVRNVAPGADSRA